MNTIVKHAASNGSNKSSTWMLQSVRSFWQGVNWENHPLELISPPNSDGTPTVLSLKLAVKQYFSLIAWTGDSIAPQATTPNLPIDDDDKSETLDDFIDDISKFF